MTPPMDSLDLDGVKRLLTAAADRVIAHRDLLTKADQAIGDGDHGVAMERGIGVVAAVQVGRVSGEEERR